jgi:hypothetical protein
MFDHKKESQRKEAIQAQELKRTLWYSGWKLEDLDAMNGGWLGYL